MAISSHDVTEKERAGIVRWRRARLEQAGFESSMAAAIARDWRSDLHRLLELVDRGCPPQLAARILAPLEEPGNWPTEAPERC
jgi:hypothetical protein